MDPQLVARLRPQMPKLPAAFECLAFEAGKNSRSKLRQWLGQYADNLGCDIVAPASLLNHEPQRQQKAVGLQIGDSVTHLLIALIPEGSTPSRNTEKSISGRLAFSISESVELIKTSQLRAGPNVRAKRFASVSRACSEGATSSRRRKYSAARSRRKATRSWCTLSGSPPFSAGQRFASICCWHPDKSLAMPSSTVSPCQDSMNQPSRPPGHLQRQGISSSGFALGFKTQRRDVQQAEAQLVERGGLALFQFKFDLGQRLLLRPGFYYTAIERDLDLSIRRVEGYRMPAHSWSQRSARVRGQRSC